MSSSSPAADERFMGRWSAELAPEFLAFARASAAGERGRFQADSAEAPPFADGSFDAAPALSVLQDVADKVEVVDAAIRD